MSFNAQLRRRTGAPLLIATALAFGILAAPSVASASGGTTYWVNNAVPTVAGHGTSCSSPGYSTIQSAINVEEHTPSGTILVCPGTYAEQDQVTGNTNLTITSADAHLGVVLTLPATPSNSTTSCDTAPGTGAYQPDQDGFAVCGSAGTYVKASDLTFDYSWPNVCDDSLYGILVGAKSTLKLTHSAIVAGGVPLSDSSAGCQGGIGMQVGMGWTTPNEAGHAIISNDTISGYQKNGVTIDGKGTTASMWQDSVEGAGATTATAQNGIQVSNGALATITKVTVSGNECNNSTCGSSALNDYQATGVLFYGAKRGTLLTDSTIADNDIGVYYASEAATLPAHSEVAVTFSSLTDNRYEGFVFDQGHAALANTKIRGGNVGVMFLQYDGQSYGDFSQITTTNIRGQSLAAVQVLSDLAPSGDKPGSVTFTNCPISGAILSNSSSYTLTFRR